MTTETLYWLKLDAAARAAAAALGDDEPDPPALLARILAAAPPPTGLCDAAEHRALRVAAAELRRLGDAQLAEAKALGELDRLAVMHGCPDGAPVVPWLIEHGLLREVAGGFELVPLGPRSVA